MTKLALVPKAPGLEALTGQVRGFCTNKDAKKMLISHGLPPHAIYQRDFGAENFAACLKSYRLRPGYLILAEDLRAFGAMKRDVSAAADALEKAGIRIIDITHPSDQTSAALVQRAHNFISKTTFKDKRTAKRLGRTGGLTKGIKLRNSRDELAPAWLVDRIVDNHDVPWAVKLALLAPHFVESTLRRNYGFKAALRRANDAQD